MVSSVVTLHLSNCGLDDQACCHLSRFPNLEVLDVSSNRITEGGVHALCLCTSIKPRLSSLQVLCLAANSPMSDGALSRINRLSRLRMLDNRVAAY